MKTIESAYRYKEFWRECQRFFGYNNFKHEEIMAIMHHINSCYMLASDPEPYGDNKAEGENHRERLNPESSFYDRDDSIVKTEHKWTCDSLNSMET